MKRLFLALVAVCLSLVCTSCRKSGPSIYPVSGKVLCRGAPATGAAVFFHRHGTDLSDQLTMGIVRDDGTFELVCGPLGKGAPAGDYDVTVEWRPVARQSGGNPQRGPDKLNGRYADVRNPLLHATVEARPNELPPFELTE